MGSDWFKRKCGFCNGEYEEEEFNECQECGEKVCPTCIDTNSHGEPVCPLCYEDDEYEF